MKFLKKHTFFQQLKIDFGLIKMKKKKVKMIFSLRSITSAKLQVEISTKKKIKNHLNPNEQ